jgi:hypothetical protein
LVGVQRALTSSTALPLWSSLADHIQSHQPLTSDVGGWCL